MGTMRFLLPSDLTATTRRELHHACLAGGYDNTPVPTRVSVEGLLLRARRELEESGYLLAPWPVEGVGQVMVSTATLMERDPPYDLVIELARGKVNQARGQAAEWRSVGLQIPDVLDDLVQTATLTFGRAVTAPPGAEAVRYARMALRQGYEAADALSREYVRQLIEARRQREPHLPTAFGCRLAGPPAGAVADLLPAACNSVALPLTWKQIEPAESQYRWEPVEAALDWAEGHGLRVAAGPLVDFSRAALPEWLSLWEGDPTSLASFFCDYVETAVQRYRGRIRRWHLCAAGNRSNILGLGEEELLALTARLVESALQIDPGLEVVLGIAQPWGEYMASEDHTYSPFIFADTLLRHGLKLAAIELEWFLGVAGRGSYCRDLMEASRLLDLYALLGVPLQVALGYPSADGPDDLADPDLEPGYGHWRAGFTPEAQAEWAEGFGSLALSKPFVTGVHWCHLGDGEPHLLPHCGLLDAAGEPKPAFLRWRDLRELCVR
jgi:hypothetical protein